MKHRVLISGKLHAFAAEKFHRDGELEVDYLPDLPHEELLRKMPDVQILVSRSETRVDRELLDQSPQLKLIARAAVGVGNIDLEEATRRGILVINCPGMNTNSAAELTMGLLLNCLRKIVPADAVMRQGGWDRHRFSGNELRHKTIGIIGLGNVGHRVARFAKGFEMKVLAYDPYIGPKVFAEHGAVHCKSLGELLDQADIVTVHVPQNDETTGMIGAAELARMRKGGVVINAARGGIINEAALKAALTAGHIAAAGIDTWNGEPSPDRGLVGLQQVVATPHIGASTEEAQLAIGDAVYDQVAKFVRQSVVDFPVNLPGVAVPDHPMIKAYAILVEKIGILAGQVLEFNPSSMELLIYGELTGFDSTLLRLGFMKGYLSQVIDSYVSYVNAPDLMEGRGIPLTMRHAPGGSDYRSGIEVVVSGIGGESLKVGGTVFESQHGRITSMNGYEFELLPSGKFLLIENDDRPGVIGNIGQFLGLSQINIDSFHLSRDQRGGRAMALIKVDSQVTDAQLAQLSRIPHITNVRSLLL